MGVRAQGYINYGFVSTTNAGYVNSSGTVLPTFGQYTLTVTANATGDGTINFGTTLSDSNYVIHGSADCGENDCFFQWYQEQQQTVVLY